MDYNGILLKFPKEIRWFITMFVVVLSIGFFTGLSFVRETGATVPTGVEENYLGNEEDEYAQVMKFKKGSREMLTIVHTHVLSMSLIFFLLGGLVWITKLPVPWKLFLSVEPFISLVMTFGGIYWMWKGITWLRYVVVFSGVLMTLTFTFSAGLVLWQCVARSKQQ